MFTEKKKGFTLLELLVVVLIIGILAAIALPQYQYAVYKARYIQLRTLVDSVVSAQRRHLLATGSYTLDFSQLDIDLPSGGSFSSSGERTTISYSKFNISVLGSTETGTHNVSYGTIKTGTGSVNYYHYYRSPSQPQCRCVTDDDCKICEKLGAEYCCIRDGNVKYYMFQAY